MSMFIPRIHSCNRELLIQTSGKCNFTLKMTAKERSKQRAIVRFSMGLGYKPVQTIKMLNISTKKQCVVRFLFFNGINGTVNDGKR